MPTKEIDKDDESKSHAFRMTTDMTTVISMTRMTIMRIATVTKMTGTTKELIYDGIKSILGKTK